MRRKGIHRMMALLLTAALCVSLCTGFTASAGEPDADVRNQTEQTEAVSKEDVSSENLPEVSEKSEAQEVESWTEEQEKGQSEEAEMSEESERRMNVRASASDLRAPRIAADSSMKAGQKVTWDCVWFGSYPQSEVTSSDAVYGTLQNADGWDSNNDITVNGNRYRRMKKGDATYTSLGEGHYIWSDSTTYHYFKYEPIKWRVLKINGNQAFLLSDIALDAHEYHRTYRDVMWKTSAIRSWLNGYDSSSNYDKVDYSDKNFIDSAFIFEEQTALLDTYVSDADNVDYETIERNDTTDKVYLLLESGIYGDSSVSYGFVSNRITYDEARRCKSSNYAKAMGVRSAIGDAYKGNCWWWLRSLGIYPNRAAHACDSGFVCEADSSTYSANFGVRPALNLNLSSNQWSYAGTVCSDGTENEMGGGSSGGDTDSEKRDLQCSRVCTVEAGSKTSLTAVAFYYNDNYEEFKAFTESITWKSEKTSVATVKSSSFILPAEASDYPTEDGSPRKVWKGTVLLAIQGIAKGSTMVTGSTPDGVKAVCKVTVSEESDGGSSGGGGGRLTLGENKSGVADKNSGVARFFPANYSSKLMVFPVEITVKEGTDGTYKLRGTVGIGKSDWLDDDTKWNKYKKNVSDMAKYTGKYDSLKQFRNIYGVKSRTAVSTDDFKILPKLSVMGYFENTYDKNWNLISWTGKLAADAKWSGSINWQYATPIGPLYLNLEGGAKTSGELGPKYDNTSKEIKITDGSLKHTPFITLEGGYGIDKVATIGAQGNLSLPITLIPATKGELSAKASLHVKLVFVIDYTQELATYKKTLWDTTDSKKKSIARNSRVSASEGIFSEMDTSFSEKTSAWNGGSGGATRRRSVSANRGLSERVLMSGVMESTLPMQAEINGKRVMIFQSYDSSRETLNSSVLMYSVCENGTWSEPKAVWDNGYADLYADMKVVNGELVLAWQKEKAAVSGDISTDSENVLEDIAKNSEICYAVFDDQTNTFSGQKYVTNNDSYDMMPKICENSKDVILSWVRNDAAEVMQENGKNTIYASKLTASSFEEEQAVVQAPGTIDDYVLFEEAGNLQSVFTGHTGDVVAVFGSGGQVIEELSELIKFSEEGRIANLNYVNGEIHCFSDGKLYTYTPSTGAVNSLLAGESAFGSEAQYCSNGEKSGYVWSAYNEETGTGSIMASMEMGDGYTEPVVLYEKAGVIWRYLSPMLTSSGEWQIAANAEDGAEELHSLVSIEKQEESRIELTGASFDENDVVNGLTGVDYFITNTGDTPVHQVEFVVALENGETIKKRQKCQYYREKALQEQNI